MQILPAQGGKQLKKNPHSRQPYCFVQLFTFSMEMSSKQVYQVYLPFHQVFFSFAENVKFIKCLLSLSDHEFIYIQ